MNILVVEDETRVADFIARGLRAEGHGVTVANDGPSGRALAAAGGFDAVVLDVMLPGMDGRAVAAALRAAGDVTPILMLTALDEVEDRVDGLGQGADDYLTKPFAFAELVARLEALGRRARRFADAGGRVLRAGQVSLDRDTLEVRCCGERIELTAKELGILELLMRRPGHVLSRERILSAVWGINEDPLTNVVDVYIGRLRRKLSVGCEPPIETVRGHGYRLLLRP